MLIDNYALLRPDGERSICLKEIMFSMENVSMEDILKLCHVRHFSWLVDTSTASLFMTAKQFGSQSLYLDKF